MSFDENDDTEFYTADDIDVDVTVSPSVEAKKMHRDIEKFVEEIEKAKEEIAEEKKPPKKIFVALAVLYMLFIFIAWPIVEYVFYSKIGQLCIKTMPGPVDLAKWLLSDAIILSIPFAFVVLMIFAMCFCCCIDLMCDCNCIDTCNALVSSIRASRNCSIVLYSIGFIVTLTIGILGIFTISWAIDYCSAPLPGIAIFITVFRFIGFISTVWCLKNLFVSCFTE